MQLYVFLLELVTQSPRVLQLPFVLLRFCMSCAHELAGQRWGTTRGMGDSWCRHICHEDRTFAGTFNVLHDNHTPIAVKFILLPAVRTPPVNHPSCRFLLCAPSSTWNQKKHPLATAQRNGERAHFSCVADVLPK